jgi:hypothetical protein
MIPFIQSWFQPTVSQGWQGRSYSSHSNTIVALALSALALFTANVFDRTNPGLALILRCIVGGVGLIWLFNRCFPTSTKQHHHGHYPAAPAPVVHVASSPLDSGWNWWPGPRWNQMHAAPVYRAHKRVQHPTHSSPGNFPTVYRTPAQPDLRYMHQAPLNREGGFPAVFRTPAQPDPRPMHQAPLNRGEGFPAVYRTPAQPDPRPMHQAQFNRSPTTYMPESNPSHTSNQTTMFPAAKHR